MWLITVFDEKMFRRKIRLYFAAACRKYLNDLRPAIEMDDILRAEKYAEGLLARGKLGEARQHIRLKLAPLESQVKQLMRAHTELPSDLRVSYNQYKIAESLLQAPCRALYFAANFDWMFDHKNKNLDLELCSIIRDIFFDPFRVPAPALTQRNGEAMEIAQVIESQSRFDAIPILADALEDAGCEDAAILSHCRDPQAAHVRGCWVVDLVLGKS
jgi:hypothetical protein